MSLPSPAGEVVVDVLPLYGQIEIGDRDTVDVPQWVTGEESTVRNETMVCVATQPDSEGEVRITVSRNVVNLYAVDWHEVFSGELSLPSGILMVGNSIAAQVEEIELSPATLASIRVLVDPPSVPRNIAVVIS